MPKDQNEIGALWIKNTGTEKEFFSGTINGESVVVFKNKYKRPGDKTPDFRVLKGRNGSTRQTREPEPESPGPVYQGGAKPGDEITDDDVPF